MNHLESTPTSAFIFYRSYSRFVEGKRETWQQMAFRCILGLEKLGKFSKKEVQLIYSQINNCTALPSGRYMWCGGTEWSDKPENYSGSYNCTSTIIDNIEAFGHLMNLSMQGAGCGAVLELENVTKLPLVQTRLSINITSKPGDAGTSERSEKTKLVWTNTNTIDITVGDSRRGWVDSYLALIQLATSSAPQSELNVFVDLSSIRPKGERLKGFGGTANPLLLKNLYSKVANILNGAVGRQLTSVECCLLICEAAMVVVVGNIRRSALIFQFSQEDKLARNIKNGLWKQHKNGSWYMPDPKLDALRMGNHTTVFHQKPTLEQCIDSVSNQYYSGEGAIQWAGEAVARANADLLDTAQLKKNFLKLYNEDRTKSFGFLDYCHYMSNHGKWMDKIELNHRMSCYGLNPCAEIIGSNFHCNLAEVHLNTINPLNLPAQVDAFRAASLNVVALLHHEFEVPRYQKSRELDPIVGVSFTGLFDFFVHLFGVEWLQWWQNGRKTSANTPIDVRTIPNLKPLVDADFIRQFHFESMSEMFLAIEEEYLCSWRRIVTDTVTKYCKQHNLKVPNRTTTCQPAGCLTADAVRISSVGMFYADELMDNGVGDCQFTRFEVRDGLTTESGISNPIRNDLIEITFSHGRKVVATPCHRFSINGEWICTNKIVTGDLLDFEAGHYLNTAESSLKYLHTPDAIGRDCQFLSFQTPNYMSPDLAYFVGAVFSNSCFSSSYQIRITHERMDILIKLQDIATRLFGLTGVISIKPRSGRAEVCFANKQLLEWLKLNNLGKSVKPADLNRVPVTIRTSTRDSILAFFAGLIDADRCIRSNDTFSIDIAAESFARNTQQIGEAVGLIFEISYNTKSSNLQSEKNIWNLSLSECGSDPNSLHKLNQFSLKTINQPLQISYKTNSKKPFVVTGIERNQSGYTYDITIDTDDDNEAWYWQGCIKSHNSKSLLTGASSGWHPPKATRYIRRMTFGRDEPIALAAIDLGYNVIPSQSDKDNDGNLLNDIYDPRVTEWLVEIPCAASWSNIQGVDEINVSQFSALAQFNFYMQVQRHYSTHTTSATIELREYEIEDLATAIYENIQNDGGYMSAALLARFDNLETFPRMPFEPINKDRYYQELTNIAMRRTISDFNEALAVHDKGQTTENGPSGCDSDKCLIGSKR